MFTDARPIMGGETVITVVGGSAAILEDAFALAATCDRLWSRFVSDSELSRVNESGGEAVEVSPLTVALVDAMCEGFSLTNGDFNPTLLPHVVALGYVASLVSPSHVTSLPPDAGVFDSLDGIVLTDTSVQVPAGMTLDAGGIGKGFAADLICAAVMKSGARGVMVSMSGDVVVAGEAPQPGGWLLGVENPFDESEQVEIVRLIEGAVVTSSQRKKRFGDKHHVVDPRTGTSATTSIQTVSVIATTGARAEVLAKSGFLRPVEDFLSWLPTIGAAGMVIGADGTSSQSLNWAPYH